MAGGDDLRSADAGRVGSGDGAELSGGGPFLRDDDSAGDADGAAGGDGWRRGAGDSGTAAP